MQKFISKQLKKAGFEIKRFPTIDQRRRYALWQHFGVNKIIDVGASIGQYALLCRRLGFKGKIISFEPLSASFAELQKNKASDTLWLIHNFALGDEATKTTINVAQNAFSSSLLEMLPAHVHSAPESQYVSQETITIKTLDSIFGTIYEPNDKIFLKIDTQGYERNVLIGAAKSLENIVGLQLEMSLMPLYADEMLFDEMLHFVQTLGFKLFSLENGFYDKKTGQLLQVDGVFFK
ncbi:MAG: FkbM family methyltransferase [Chitinophagales bacterium]|nr:FkbM family methyltransferase [Bacteroidota bacterium]MCB9042809.1 FkbM family methyltransferase [Chitinophagales bacterium]